MSVPLESPEMQKTTTPRYRTTTTRWTRPSPRPLARARLWSRPSRSRATHIRIYPSSELNANHLMTKALVLGDFGSVVPLYLLSDRFADAILFAVRSSPELLARTQKSYFERRMTTVPYLRLFPTPQGDLPHRRVTTTSASSLPRKRSSEKQSHSSSLCLLGTTARRFLRTPRRVGLPDPPQAAPLR